MISPNAFFDLFLDELASSSPEMTSYYKFLEDEKYFNFRKAYFIQRLQYIIDQIDQGEKRVFDCGCGYGTTGLFLAMNGIQTYGTTLEFYFDQVQRRKDFWRHHGDADLFQVDYADLFDEGIGQRKFDYIIVQDTLHHLEPIDEAIAIFSRILDEKGKLIAVEENGSNVIQRLKLFAQRGNQRVITLWDERLQKKILLGNENIRSLSSWRRIFLRNQMEIEEETVRYIRYFLPPSYRKSSMEELVDRERELAEKAAWRREYFFFGLNFSARKCRTRNADVLRGS